MGRESMITQHWRMDLLNQFPLPLSSLSVPSPPSLPFFHMHVQYISESERCLLVDVIEWYGFSSDLLNGQKGQCAQERPHKAEQLVKRCWLSQTLNPPWEQLIKDAGAQKKNIYVDLDICSLVTFGRLRRKSSSDGVVISSFLVLGCMSGLPLARY